MTLKVKSGEASSTTTTWTATPVEASADETARSMKPAAFQAGMMTLTSMMLVGEAVTGNPRGFPSNSSNPHTRRRPGESPNACRANMGD